jgi:CNT family concentrative nucleoside transporter
VLRTKVGYDIFAFISLLARELLGFAGEGVEFLTDPSVTALTWFLTGVIPAIIFFIALVQMLYYWGIIQWFIGKFAVFFFWSMKVSGAEAVVAAATPFIGQGESAMLIKPFVQYLTKAGSQRSPARFSSPTSTLASTLRCWFLAASCPFRPRSL